MVVNNAILILTACSFASDQKPIKLSNTNQCWRIYLSHDHEYPVQKYWESVSELLSQRLRQQLSLRRHYPGE